MLTKINFKNAAPFSTRMTLLITLSVIVFVFTGCSGGGGGGGNGTDDGGSTDDFTLEAGSAYINVSKLQVPFGGVVLDHFSDKTISILNTGSSNLDIGQIAQKKLITALENTPASPFSIINDSCSGNTLAASEECTFQIRFFPAVQGTFNDSFEIPSNDADENSMTVSASGDGRTLNVIINQVEVEACPRVKLYITVTDRNDDPQTGITQNDFSLFENDVLQDITGFTNKTTSPLSVALALDYSSSTIPATLDIEAAAKNFIDLLDTADNDETAIIKFDRDIFLTQAFTTSKDDLKAAIDEPFPNVRAGSSIFDAVWQAIDATAAAQNERLAVILLSDGGDNSPVNSLSEVIDHALDKGVPVFTIGLGNINSAVLQQLADETGGLYFSSPTSDELQAIYLQIAEILANQYVLEYNSSLFGGLSTILDVDVDFNALQGEDSKVFMGCP